MRCRKSSSKRKVYCNKQKKERFKYTNLCLKKLEKRKQTEPKVRRGKEIIKIRAEINETEKRRIIENKPKSWFFEKINKIDKVLTTLTKEKKRRPKSVKS